MPALPPAFQTLKITLFITIGLDSHGLVRHYMQYTGTAPTNNQAAGLATFIGNSYGANLAGLAAGGVNLTQVQVIDLSSASGAQGVATGAQNGTRAGNALPADVATLQNFTMQRRYRGGHPRTYWPFGVAGDLLNDQTWSGTFVTAVTNGLNAWYTAIFGAVWSGGGSLNIVNVSYYQGFTVVTSPTTHRARNVPTVRVTPVIDQTATWVINPRPATQRRRSGFSR